MNITSYFTTDNAGTTGLLPTITIVLIPDGTKIVDADPMTELDNANGWYTYTFTAYNGTQEFIFTADAGVDTVDDRYPTATNGVGSTVWKYKRD